MGDSRWRIALHEAGHVVAGAFFANGTPAGAVLLPEGGGLAYLTAGDAPRTFGEALAVAAGLAAEALVADCDPPAVGDTIQADAPTPELTACVERAEADYKKALPDDTRLARWACETLPGHPERWAGRVYWIRAAADDFVRRHAAEIVAVAGELYRLGIVFHRHEACQELEVFTMQKMAEVEQAQQKRARELFIEAAWAGAAPGELYDLAKSSGMSPPPADDLVETVKKTLCLVAEAGGLPALRREADKTAKAAGDVEARNRREVERLELEVDSAAVAADAARQRLRDAERAASELLRAADAGLVPADKLPREAKRLLDRRERAADAARRDAECVRLQNEVNRRRHAVEGLRGELRGLPLSVNERPQRRELERRIDAAKAALTAKEKELAALQKK